MSVRVKKRGRPRGSGKKQKEKAARLIQDQAEEDIEMEEDRRKRALEEGEEGRAMKFGGLIVCVCRQRRNVVEMNSTN
eukprot:4838187-Heterocapsa_arctica.AAC.1